jgi:hypothetical protein
LDEIRRAKRCEIRGVADVRGKVWWDIVGGRMVIGCG